MRQPGLQRHPLLTGVERDIERAAGAGEKQITAVGIFSQRAHIARGADIDAADDEFPAMPEVRSLEDVGLGIADETEVHGDIRRRRVEMRRLYAGDGSQRRQAVQVLRDIGPITAAIARQPDLPIVRARPDEPLLGR